MPTVKVRTTFTVFSIMTCTQSFLFQWWFVGSCRNGDAKLNVTIFQATVDARVYPSLCCFFVLIFNICGKMTLNIHSNVCMHTNPFLQRKHFRQVNFYECLKSVLLCEQQSLCFQNTSDLLCLKVCCCGFVSVLLMCCAFCAVTV